MTARRSRWLTAALVIALAAAAGLVHARRQTLASERPRARHGDAAVLSADIAFYEARVARDPRSAADLARLASLYLQRSRETGDASDLARAERQARRSLAIRGYRNSRARLVLASSLLAGHRFGEAYREAKQLVEGEAAPASHRALLGEIELELGRYDAARRTFGSLERESSNLAVAPRLARWLELNGNPERARALLLRARREAWRRADLPREQVAWFELRLADLALRHGRTGEARRAIESGLAANPGDRRLLAAAARLAAMQGRWMEAIKAGLRAESSRADLATLALVGDAFMMSGDTARALLYWNKVERANTAAPEPYARQWTQFRLDHRRRLAETRRILEAEITERPDVLGWDMLAWARYLTGDFEGAGVAIAEALRMGTRDAPLYYHAALIAMARGDSAEGSEHLARSRQVNPYFERYLRPMVTATPTASAATTYINSSRGTAKRSHRS